MPSIVLYMLFFVGSAWGTKVFFGFVSGLLLRAKAAAFELFRGSSAHCQGFALSYLLAFADTALWDF
ncbi:MAG: hypothetical protein RSD76_05170 [Clostridia bacterium]